MAKLKLVNGRTVEQWAEIIKAKWQDSVSNIIETGLSLYNAREELGVSDFLTMVQEKLNFSKSTVYKLIAIGTDVRLQECTMVHLPASWRTLYELTRLTDEQFQHGIDAGIIHAGMERKDVAKLKPPRDKRQPKTDAILTGRDLIEQRTIAIHGQILATLRECGEAEQVEFLALIRLQLDDIETKRKQAS